MKKGAIKVKHKLLLTILCAAAVFSMSACGATSTVTDQDVASPPASSVPASDVPEVSDTSAQPEGDSDAGETDSEKESQDTELENAIPSSQAPEIPTQPEETTPAPTVPENRTEQPVDTAEEGAKILIAYFTWAENTVVDDPSAVDVDATTSASVLAPGHVAQMAAWIQAKTGGDLFSIITADPYSSNYDECLDRAADEKADNARPALSGSVGNMDEYDVVFLGYPDWWATCPMAVFTFLDSYDFTGKTVIPFCAHGTSGLASSVRDIRAALPDVTVLDAVGVQRLGMDTPLSTAQATVETWLEGLKY